MTLDGSIISLEFAPLTENIRINNIPGDQGAYNPYDINFIFSNKKIGDGPITEMMLERTIGAATVSFEKTSGISLPYFNQKFTQ
jgi:hypothetical protein